MSTVLPLATQCAFLGLSHSPLLGLSTLPEPVDRRLRDALARTAAAVREWSPDLIVLVAPDHYNNFFHELMPPFCLGAEAEAIGDYGTPAGPLRVAEAEALALGEFLADSGFDVAVSRRMRVDHGFVQALQLLWGGLETPPVIPLFLNAVARPAVPRPFRCVQLGEAIGRFLGTKAGRVLAIGSGGLSHEPPLPSIDSSDPRVRERVTVRHEQSSEDRERRVRGAVAAGQALAARDPAFKPLNPAWDTRWMDAVDSGDLAPLLALDEAGISREAGESAHESKTWLVACSAACACAAGQPQQLQTALRFYEAIPELIAGFGILLKLPQSPAGASP